MAQSQLSSLRSSVHCKYMSSLESFTSHALNVKYLVWGWGTWWVILDGGRHHWVKYIAFIPFNHLIQHCSHYVLHLLKKIQYGVLPWYFLKLSNFWVVTLKCAKSLSRLYSILAPLLISLLYLRKITFHFISCIINFLYLLGTLVSTLYITRNAWIRTFLLLIRSLYSHG
jgi:hypothetical protein